jgi:hypothetical protein
MKGGFESSIVAVGQRNGWQLHGRPTHSSCRKRWEVIVLSNSSFFCQHINKHTALVKINPKSFLCHYINICIELIVANIVFFRYHRKIHLSIHFFNGSSL